MSKTIGNFVLVFFFLNLISIGAVNIDVGKTVNGTMNFFGNMLRVISGSEAEQKTPFKKN